MSKGQNMAGDSEPRTARWWPIRGLRITSIRTQLLLTLVLMVFLPTAVSGLVSAVMSWRSGQQQVVNQLELMATLKETEITAWANSLQTNLDGALAEEQVRHTLTLLQAANPSVYLTHLVRASLEQVIAQGGGFEELFLMDPQGRVVLSTMVGQEGQDYSDQAFFQKGLSTSYVQVPFYLPGTDQRSVVVVRPMVDEEETVWGVLAGRVNLDAMSQIVRGRVGLEVGEIYLVGGDRTLLTQRDTGEEEVQLHTQGANAAIEKQSNGFGLYEDHLGVPVVGVYHWLPDLQIALLAEQDRAGAFGATYTTVGVNIGVTLVSVLLAVVASLFVTRSIATPLVELAETARQIAAGDLERTAEVKREDETGALAEAFNSMTARLRDRLQNEQEQRKYLQSTIDEYVDHMARVGQGNLAVRLTLDRDGQQLDDPLTVLGHQLNDTTASLQDMIRHIRDAAKNLGSTVSEILAATTQQVAGATEQSTAITEASTTIDEVRSIAEQTAQRAQGVAGLAQQTAEVSDTGQQAVAQTIGGMSLVKDKVEMIAQNILALSERAQAVGQIITTVNEIAKQSNMLALNAAVEAARAGETGKGFAVVAAEVRALADQSRAATVQVQGILTEIQRGVNAAVMATEEGMKGTDAGMNLAGEAGLALQKLAESVAESTQAARQIATAAEQQLTGMEQIATAMENIHQVTAQSVSGTRQTEKAAEELNGLAGELRELVGAYQL